MKRLKRNVSRIIVGLLLILPLVVMADIAIPAGSVSYSNDQTNATTVESALDELIDKVVKDYECSGSSCKKCVRARTLHKEECTQTDSTNYCSGAGYNSSKERGTTIITYGNIQGNTGVLKSGDAFDCDVNGDGLYDSDTERFYYVSDLDNETAVLIYYNNVSAGEPTNDKMFAYDESSENWHGPITAVKQLPKTTQWKNVSLKNSSRNISTETGRNATSGGTIENPFSYKGYAARFLTYQEVATACGNANITSIGSLNQCNFLLENTKYASSSSVYFGYWLETPYSSYTFSSWGVYGHISALGNYETNIVNNRAVRPVIEVLKSDISY